MVGPELGPNEDDREHAQQHELEQQGQCQKHDPRQQCDKVAQGVAQVPVGHWPTIAQLLAEPAELITCEGLAVPVRARPPIAGIARAVPVRPAMRFWRSLAL